MTLAQKHCICNEGDRIRPDCDFCNQKGEWAVNKPTTYYVHIYRTLKTNNLTYLSTAPTQSPIPQVDDNFEHLKTLTFEL